MGGFWSNFSNGTQDTVHKDTVGHKAFEVMYMEWDTRLETAFFGELEFEADKQIITSHINTYLVWK